MAMAAAALPTILTVGSTLMTVFGGIQQANAIEAEGESINQQKIYEARQAKVKAGQERATAQRAANEQKRKTNLASSNFRAQAAAGGGTGNDAGLVSSLADILTEGQYRQDIETYQGDDSAAGLESGAALSEYEGQSALRASKTRARAVRVGAFSTLLSGGNTLFDKYAPDKTAAGS